MYSYHFHYHDTSGPFPRKIDFSTRAGSLDRVVHEVTTMVRNETAHSVSIIRVDAEGRRDNVTGSLIPGSTVRPRETKAKR